MGFAVSETVTINLNVHIAYDREADVWYVAESDIPGLRLEAVTPGDLIQRLIPAAEEMIELNSEEIFARHVEKRKVVKMKRPAPKAVVTPVFDTPMFAYA